MATQTEVELYNYEHFQGTASNFVDFRTHLPVGSQAPDFTGTSLDTGARTNLSEFWQEKDLLLEFGSIT